MAAADSCPKTGGRLRPPRRTVRKRLEQPMPGRSPRIRCANFPRTTAAFTFPSIRWASPCCAGLPLGRALYAVSVRRLAGLASSFLWTIPRGIALAFGSRFHRLISRRGLAPHELTPMPGVHLLKKGPLRPFWRGVHNLLTHLRFFSLVVLSGEVRLSEPCVAFHVSASNPVLSSSRHANATSVGSGLCTPQGRHASRYFRPLDRHHPPDLVGG